MRSCSILLLALLASLFVTAASAAPGQAPASPSPDFPAWLAATAGDLVGTPSPLPMSIPCVWDGTFCEHAACTCRGGSGSPCPCGGTLSSCSATTHTFTCLCTQCV